MSDIKNIEWYDGQLQFLKKVEDRAFYGVCIDANLASPSFARTYLIIEIDDFEQDALLGSLGMGAERIDEVVRGLSKGHLGVLHTGEPDSFSPSDVVFDVPSENYVDYFIFPVVDLLAE